LACGQRIFTNQSEELPGEPATQAETGHGIAAGGGHGDIVDAIEEIRVLSAVANDWICPFCGVTVRSHTRPNSRLGMKARLLLACNIPVTAVWVAAMMWVSAEIGMRIPVFAMVLPTVALSWWALSLPRVVLLRCVKCGSVHRQYRLVRGFFGRGVKC